VQLDKTRIAVREREYIDILDLALRVCRVYAWPLLLAFSAGIVPMMVLNSWLLAGLADSDFGVGFPAYYMVLMVLLMFLEAPLATAPATLYLGKAVFAERPDAGEILRDFRQSLPQLLRYQVLLRPWYLRWPYLNEVILLEREPVRPATAGAKPRGQVLHEGPEHELIGRWLGTAMVGGVLFTSFWLSIFLVRVVLLGEWQWEFGRPMFTFYFQLALWIVVGYFTVVRFLSYLDLRIRREGWEVELWMRAERARLARQWK